MKKLIFIPGIIILLSVFGFYFLVAQAAQKDITINHYQLSVDIARIPQEYERGLSGRKSLQENQGMLFVFPKEDNVGFWMIDMNFPLDIIWMNKNCEVVYISKNTPACQNRETCPVINPYKPSQYVLEVVSGFSEKHYISIGEKLDIC